MDRDVEERIKAAEAAVRELAEEFVDFVQVDIKIARNSLTSAKISPDDCRVVMEEYFTAIHNIKGLGGSFGYNLVTMVADSNCRLLKFVEAQGDQVLRLCEAHLMTLESILGKNIKGDGGDAGKQIVDKLSGSVSKLFTERGVKE